MAKIVDILASGPSSSFEFFPPKTPAAEEQLELALGELEPLQPSFVSVTYGAGGSTRERTHDLVVRINRDTSMTAMAHLTCAAHTRAELTEIVDALPRRRRREHPLARRRPAQGARPPAGRARRTRSSWSRCPRASATSRWASPCTPRAIPRPPTRSKTASARPRSSRSPTSGCRSSSSTPTCGSSSSAISTRSVSRRR